MPHCIKQNYPDIEVHVNQASEQVLDSTTVHLPFSSGYTEIKLQVWKNPHPACHIPTGLTTVLHLLQEAVSDDKLKKKKKKT